MLASIVSISLGAILVNNFIFSQFLGLCPFLGVSNKMSTATGMSVAVIFVMTMASAICWVINTYLLIPLGLKFMQTVAYILVIAVLVQFVEMFLKKSIPSLYSAMGIFLPLITTNCAVLGVAINVVTKEYTFGGDAHMLGLGEATVYALATSIGYGLAMILFAGLREHLEMSDVPKPFKGLPIAIITVSIMAMAFLGFSGMV